MVDEATCSACHGEGLVGQGNVPALAGRSPSYIARQLNDFKQGARKGPMASQMTSPVARLTVDDITHIAAYIASLPVAP